MEDKYHPAKDYLCPLTAHPTTTHPSSNYCLRPCICSFCLPRQTAHALHQSGASSSLKGKSRSLGLQTRLPQTWAREPQQQSSREDADSWEKRRIYQCHCRALALWLLPTTLNQQNTP